MNIFEAYSICRFTRKREANCAYKHNGMNNFIIRQENHKLNLICSFNSPQAR